MPHVSYFLTGREKKNDEQINESVESTMNDTLMCECVVDAFVLSLTETNAVVDMVAAITCV